MVLTLLNISDSVAIGLVAGGADTNLQDNVTGMSPLMATIQNNHTAMAQFLIALQVMRDGCDINLVDKSNTTALFHAVEQGKCLYLMSLHTMFKQIIWYLNRTK